MLIYIASSFRNYHGVQMLRDQLLARGHTVIDWTTLPPALPQSLTPEQRRAALDADETGKIARTCTEACASADLVIYYGPSGSDAGAELGIAKGSGVPVVGITSPLDTPGLIVNHIVERWFDDYNTLLRHVTELESRMQ